MLLLILVVKDFNGGYSRKNAKRRVAGTHQNKLKANVF
jgi:hypothetical protein